MTIFPRSQGDRHLALRTRVGDGHLIPFNPTTELSFVIGHSSFASLKVYSLTGQEVATLVDRELKAGVHRVTFNADD